MRSFSLAAGLLVAMALPAAAPAQGDEIVVRGDVRRLEIERILEADNVDTSRLPAREVADAMAQIARGRAPDDFWLAYRAHVAAWQRLAAAEGLRRRAGTGGFGGEDALMRAEAAIDTTFDEVERIARRYGARMPTPPWQRVPTV